jgi:hypothetical protein
VVTGAGNDDTLALAFHKWKSLLTDIADDGLAKDGSDRVARVEGVCAGTVSAGLSPA